jgi:hypothetical protein
MDLRTATRRVAAIAGKTAAGVFDDLVDEFVYYVRSVALVKLSEPREKVRDRFSRLCGNAVLKVAKIGVSAGDVMGPGATSGAICGKDMHGGADEIASRLEAAGVADFLLSMAMSEFGRGRRLGFQIFRRMRGLGEETAVQAPVPLEAVEVELMRLERKLPDLSDEEATRLTACYEMVSRR